MISTLFRQLLAALAWALLLTLLLGTIGALLREWPVQGNRLTAISIDVERELEKLTRR